MHTSPRQLSVVVLRAREHAEASHHLLWWAAASIKTKDAFSKFQTPMILSPLYTLTPQVALMVQLLWPMIRVPCSWQAPDLAPRGIPKHFVEQHGRTMATSWDVPPYSTSPE